MKWIRVLSSLMVMSGIALAAVSITSYISPFVVLLGAWNTSQPAARCMHNYEVQIPSIPSETRRINTVIEGPGRGHWVYSSANFEPGRRFMVIDDDILYYGHNAFRFVVGEPDRSYASRVRVGEAIRQCGCGDQGVHSSNVYASVSLRFAAVALIAVGILLAATSGMARAFRRRRGMCVGCGYMLCGLPSARCPECGLPIKDAKGDGILEASQQ